MWGTSFADLARKAQEQASSLTEQANNLTSPVGAVSLFNLDSMQSSTDVDNSTTPATTTTATSLFSALSGDPAPAPKEEETAKLEEFPVPPAETKKEDKDAVAVPQTTVTKLDTDGDGDGDADEWDWDDEGGDHTDEAPDGHAWKDGIAKETESSSKSTQVLAEPPAAFQLGSVAALAVSAMGNDPAPSEPPAAQTPSEMLLAAALADAANDDEQPTSFRTTAAADQSDAMPTSSSFHFDGLHSNYSGEPRDLEVTDPPEVEVEEKIPPPVQHEVAPEETRFVDNALFGDENGDGWDVQDEMLEVDQDGPQELEGELDNKIHEPVGTREEVNLAAAEEVDLVPAEDEADLVPLEEEVDSVVQEKEADLILDEEHVDLVPDEEQVGLVEEVDNQHQPFYNREVADKVPTERIETDSTPAADEVANISGSMPNIPPTEAFEIGDDEDDVDDPNNLDDDDIMDMYDDEDGLADLNDIDDPTPQGGGEEDVVEIQETGNEDAASTGEKAAEDEARRNLSGTDALAASDLVAPIDHGVEESAAIDHSQTRELATADEETFETEEKTVPNEVEAPEPSGVDSQPLETARDMPADGTDVAGQAAEPPRAESLPQHTIEKFMEQLQRIDAEHQSEMEALQRQYQAELEALRDENKKLTESAAASSNRGNNVALHDKYLTQMRALESDFNKQLREKDEETKDTLHEKERLAKESAELKSEIKRLTERVSSGEDIVSKLTEQHGRGIEGMDKKLASVQADLREKNAEVSRLQDALSSAKSDLESANSAYDDLKERVKGVATELKERRQECRGLTASVEELTESKTMLETQVSNLQSQLTQYERSVVDKDEELETVRSKASAAAAEIESLNKTLKEQSAVGEKALTSYKKKAQTSLAAANSRAAVANQAREEAEADANAARATAEQAVERARVAENEKKLAVEEAQKDVVSLRAQLQTSSVETSKLNDDNEDLREELLASKAEVDDLKSERTVLLKDIEVSKQNLDKEREKNALLAQEVSQEKRKSSAFAKEAEQAKEEVERTASAAFMSRQREANSSFDDDKFAVTGSAADYNASVASDLGADEAEGTILMLQHELAGANEAIEELKDALRNALENPGSMNGTAGLGEDGLDHKSVAVSVGESADGTAADSEGGGGSTPLLFALQKQSELDTAHNEINRLANLLGDAEAEKRDAYDAMDDMRRRMEEAEARLRRMEKLGPGVSTSNANAVPAASATDRYKIGAMGVSGGQHLGVGIPPMPVTAEEDPNRSVVNLEYLKNVMLSYFNAKTMKERKSLVPAVAAVLELTPDELDMALQSVEESAGLQGVTSSLWESLENTAQSLL